MDPSVFFEKCFNFAETASVFVHDKAQIIGAYAQKYVLNTQFLSDLARRTASRVSELFDRHKNLLAFVTTSTVVAALDISRFLPGFAMGTCGKVLVELISGQDYQPVLADRSRECAIAQLALAAVCAGNRLVRAMATNPYWSRQPQEIGVSAFVSGVVSGIMFVTAAKKIYNMATTNIQTASTVIKT